jgi:hypothetical protein
MSNTITNKGDIYYSLQQILNKKGGDYRSLNDRKESKITEYDLEKELNDYNITICNETKDFERSLSFNNCNTVDDYINESSDYLGGTCNKYYDFIPYRSSEILFLITKDMDYINDIYLEIEFEQSFYGLTLDEKMHLFNMDIILEIGRNQILKSTVLTLLIGQLCLDKKINEYDNKIQIPILSFETMKYGLPLRSIMCNNIEIIISTKQSYNFRKSMQLLCVGTYNNNININDDYSYLILNGNMYDFPDVKNNIYENIQLNKLIKGLFIYFMPKDINYLYTNPNIKDIKLKIDKFQPLEYNSDNLSSIEILGITVYVVSFCEEFDTIDDITKCLKNPSDNMSANGINFCNYYRILLSLDSDDNLENYTMFVTPINLNILQLNNKTAGLKYS